VAVRIAIDLRVDGDTRFLLEHVEAATRCGIGLQPVTRFGRRAAAAIPGRASRPIVDEPTAGHAAPIRTPFYRENDFSVTNTHPYSIPYILCRPADSRTFGLRLLTALPRLADSAGD
jgi:hypothetical protein